MKLPNTEIERAAADGDIRAYLNHVHLNVEQKHVVATDGHILAVVPVEVDEEDTTGPISIDAIKHARKGPKKSDATIIANGEQRIPLMGMTLARPNDGTFPDYNMCLGRVSKSGLSLSFDAGLLFELARALNRRDSKNLGVRLDLPSHCSGGIAVTPADGPEGAHGVIMPMHLDSETEAAYTRGMEAASRSARMLETIKETRDELKGLKSGIAKSLTLKLEDVLRENGVDVD